MARATYTEIAEAIVAKEQKFIVIPPFEDDMALSVYPPKTYATAEYVIDVYLKDNTAEFWSEGYKVRKLTSIQDANAVAEAIIVEVEKLETQYKAAQ